MAPAAGWRSLAVLGAASASLWEEPAAWLDTDDDANTAPRARRLETFMDRVSVPWPEVSPATWPTYGPLPPSRWGGAALLDDAPTPFDVNRWEGAPNRSRAEGVPQEWRTLWLFGGKDGGQSTNALHSYDFATSSWVPRMADGKGLPPPVFYPALSRVGDYLFVNMGRPEVSPDEAAEVQTFWEPPAPGDAPSPKDDLARTFRYEIRAGHWREMQPASRAPPPRQDFCSITHKGVLYAAFGRFTDYTPQEGLKDVVALNLTSMMWYSQPSNASSDVLGRYRPHCGLMQLEQRDFLVVYGGKPMLMQSNLLSAAEQVRVMSQIAGQLLRLDITDGPSALSDWEVFDIPTPGPSSHGGSILTYAGFMSIAGGRIYVGQGYQYNVCDGDCTDYALVGGGSRDEVYILDRPFSLDTTARWWRTVVAGGRLPSARAWYGQTSQLASGDLALFGGINPSAGTLNDVWTLKFNTSATNTSDDEVVWYSVHAGAMETPSPRASHAAVRLGSLMVLLFGAGPVQGVVQELNDVWAIDLASQGQWAKLPLGPSARHSAAVAAFGTMVFVFGGASGSSMKDDLWLLVGAAPPGGFEPWTLLGGGRCASKLGELYSHERLDLSRGDCRAACAELLPCLAYSTIAEEEDLEAVGACALHLSERAPAPEGWALLPGQVAPPDKADGRAEWECWQRATPNLHFTWEEQPRTMPWPAARLGATAVALDGRVYLFGGLVEDSSVATLARTTGELWTWSTSGGRWRAVEAVEGSSSVGGRYGHAMMVTGTAHPRLVIFGGVCVEEPGCRGETGNTILQRDLWSCDLVDSTTIRCNRTETEVCGRHSAYAGSGSTFVLMGGAGRPADHGHFGSVGPCVDAEGTPMAMTKLDVAAGEATFIDWKNGFLSAYDGGTEVLPPAEGQPGSLLSKGAAVSFRDAIYGFGGIRLVFRQWRSDTSPRYTNEAWQAARLPSCAAGSTAAADGACLDCPAGTVGDAAGSDCVPCPAGFFLPYAGFEGLQACQPCPVGFFSGGTGAVRCEPCSFSVRCGPAATEDERGNASLHLSDVISEQPEEYSPPPERAFLWWIVLPTAVLGVFASLAIVVVFCNCSPRFTKAIVSHDAFAHDVREALWVRWVCRHELGKNEPDLGSQLEDKSLFGGMMTILSIFAVAVTSVYMLVLFSQANLYEYRSLIPMLEPKYLGAAVRLQVVASFDGFPGRCSCDALSLRLDGLEALAAGGLSTSCAGDATAHVCTVELECPACAFSRASGASVVLRMGEPLVSLAKRVHLTSRISTGMRPVAHSWWRGAITDEEAPALLSNITALVAAPPSHVLCGSMPTMMHLSATHTLFQRSLQAPEEHGYHLAFRNIDRGSAGSSGNISRDLTGIGVGVSFDIGSASLHTYRKEKLSWSDFIAAVLGSKAGIFGLFASAYAFMMAQVKPGGKLRKHVKKAGMQYMITTTSSQYASRRAADDEDETVDAAEDVAATEAAEAAATKSPTSEGNAKPARTSGLALGSPEAKDHDSVRLRTKPRPADDPDNLYSI